MPPHSPLHGLIIRVQQTYSLLFEICPLIMRTQAVLLVRDAIVAFCSADSASSRLVIDPRLMLPTLSQERDQINGNSFVKN